MDTWLLKKSTQLVPKRVLGKAVVYTLKQWQRQDTYLDYPYATPDNNFAVLYEIQLCGYWKGSCL